jgi:ATP-dependent DNA helicase RecG
MTDAELEVLLADLESDRVERKSSASDHEKIRETVCSFANDLPNHRLPGVIFVGVNDDGSCSGLKITDDLLTALAGIRDEGRTLPFPSLTVQKKTLRGCEMVVVVVQPADAPPVRFRGRTWIRVGPRRAVATPEEERRLTEKRRAKDAPFDIRPWGAATIDDLDMDLFRRTYLPASVAPEVLVENQRTEGQQMASLRLTLAGVPTVLGVLVLAKDSRAFLPGAYVQFLRIDGTGLADPVRDAAAISGPLSELIRAMEEKLVAHIETSRDFSSSPVDYWKFVLDAPPPSAIFNDPEQLAILRPYPTLMEMAQEARKPMFHLKPADGAIGAFLQSAEDARRDFEALAKAIVAKANLPIAFDR